jgi:NAD+ synthase (glutamine-hydrolysing)
MKIGFAQINPVIGDFAGNETKILNAYHTLVAQGAELVLTPELAIAGYPPQDLVFKSRFVPRNLEVLESLHARVGEVPLVVGYVDLNEGIGKPFRNAAALLQRGTPIRKFFKSLLPSYDVFDEGRYFESAHAVAPVIVAGRKIGITLCEDIWTERYLPRRLYGASPVESLVSQGAEILLNLSASPFSLGKAQRRAAMLAEVARTHRIPVCYCNAVGGNDELIFDGNSLAFSAGGDPLAKLAPLEEQLEVIDLAAAARPVSFQSDAEELFHALSLGLRDYAAKCRFQSVVLGLSGGIDSALTACIAAHALGAQNVLGVTMPTEFSSRGSIEDSEKLAANLGIRFLNVPIQASFESFKNQFQDVFRGQPEDVTEENMQPRLRGMTLMAISNKFGHLVLSTGNKSELAVGYCTLYGDMCGGLAVISDLPKTWVYRVSEWINRETEIIPVSTLQKPPSAELKHDQRDQDTLPPYEVLDPILHLYVEEERSVAEIVQAGFEEATVRWVQRRVDLNEYKRAQAAPGLKVTSRAFGSGRRMPVAQGFVQ